MNLHHEILKLTRKAKDLTQKQLSAKLGVPQSHLSKIEAGQVDLRLSTLQEHARMLDLEPMLIPKHYLVAVQAMINEEDSREPAWQPDEEGADG